MTITHDTQDNTMSKRGFLKTKSNKGATIPTRGSKHSAGYDFVLQEDLTIEPQSSSKASPLGIKAYMQEDEVLMLFVRSSLGFKRGIVLANGTAIIDSDYFNNPSNEGEIHVKLYNNSGKTVVLKKGERIVQGIFVKYMPADYSDYIDETRTGGIGSTNK